MTNKTRWLIASLVFIIVVLGGILVYAFVFAPAVTGYTVDKQNEGVQIAISTILNQIQQNGFVQIPVGENQTLVLVPYQAPTQ